MTNKLAVSTLLALVCALLAGPALGQADGASYLIMARDNHLPAGLERQVRASGGTVTRTIPEIGLAVASSSDADFAHRAARIRGVSAVMPNVTLQWIDPVSRLEAELSVDDVGDPPFSGSADFFFDLQWGHAAIGAASAWADGIRGAGARVAILDTGFDLTHPDLAPNIDFALSANFVDGETLQYALPGPFSHGSHVAGTVAAAQNDFGTIGVAPDATLVLVKVLGDAGSGTFGDVITGIVYAANVGADVINMSLGATLPKRGIFDEDGNLVAGANDVAALLNAISRATSYAYRQGTTIIASAGNSALNSDQTADLVHIPSQSSHVISISATGPVGWALDPETSFERLASYSNYGMSHIDFAAPGGDFVLPGEDPCTVAGLTRPCWVFDMVFSTGNGSWFWSVGTSMAAPHAAGVAALIIGANGGSMHPAQVESVLRATARDFGKPGKDAFFGHGQVSASPE
jgi:lantibiotic leader peptide-processing serine protease